MPENVCKNCEHPAGRHKFDAWTTGACLDCPCDDLEV